MAMLADSPEDRSHGQFRVLQFAGKKIGMKLEPVFWEQLAGFAQDDRTTVSKLVFRVLSGESLDRNRSSIIRCYCLDRLRKKPQAPASLKGATFDLFAMVSACPTPAAILTGERKLVAVNSAFSQIMLSMRGRDTTERAINLTFSEPLPRIQHDLLERPTEIKVYHLGLHVGQDKARHFRARFALAERNLKFDSLMVVFLET